MTEVTLFPYAVAAISALVAAIVGLLAWVGTQLKQELRDLKNDIRRELAGMAEQMGATNAALTSIERDLRGQLAGLDRRVVQVETRCVAQHGD